MSGASKGSSIYDVYTEGREGQDQVGACGWGGSPSCRHPQKKLDPIDVILSSSHAKKLVFLYQNFVFGQNKKVEIVYQYKLLIVGF